MTGVDRGEAAMKFKFKLLHCSAQTPYCGSGLNVDASTDHDAYLSKFVVSRHKTDASFDSADMY